MDLQRMRVKLSSRHADAVVALAAALSAQAPASATAPRGPSAAATPLTATYIAARACLRHDADLHPGADAQPPDTRHPAGPPVRASAVLKQPSRVQSLHDRWLRPPRPIESFRASASISCGDIREASGTAAALPDYSQHSIAALIEKVCQDKAFRSCKGPPDEVCWFAQMHFEAAPGVPISASATLSTAECVASFGMHFLLTRLELALITAIARGQRGACAACAPLGVAKFSCTGGRLQ